MNNEMSKEQFQARGTEMIEELKKLIVDDKITILGRRYKVTKINKWSMELSTNLRGRYVVSCTPKSSVVEGQEYGVYFIYRDTSWLKNFTIKDCETVELRTS